MSDPDDKHATYLIFFLSLLLSALFLFWNIENFPIYFFCDEATLAIVAREWIHNGWRDGNEILFPMFYQIAPSRWAPMLGSYLSIPGTALLGNTVWGVRITHALYTLAGSAATALITRRFFSPRYWWMTPLVFAVIPCWFIHGRAAFYNMATATFLAISMFFYLLYRYRSGYYIFPTILSAACCFYSYSSSQIAIPVIAVGLFFSDLRYHIHFRKKHILLTVLLAIFVALPALRFNLSEIRGLSGQLRALDSYLLKPIPLEDKIHLFTKQYWRGISPYFWTSPAAEQNPRHRLQGQGHLPVYFLPLIFIGILVTLTRIHTANYRALMIYALAIPIPAAMFEATISRLLMLLVPFVLWAIIGFDWILERLKHPRALALATWIGLAIAGCLMTFDAITNGPLWVKNYSLYGMQYGSRQLFGEAIPQYLKNNPETSLRVSPDWANDPNPFIRFFLTPSEIRRVRLNSPNLTQKMEISDNEIFVLPNEQLQQVIASGNFKPIDTKLVIPYPDGTPGFWFVKLEYIDDIDKKLEAERQQRLVLIESQVKINGYDVVAHHSRLDIGVAQQMFDGDTNTVGRGLEANPFLLELDFPALIRLKDISGDFHSIIALWDLSIFDEESKTWQTYSKELDTSHGEGMMSFGLPHSILTHKVKMSIKNTRAGEVEHLHIWDIAFAIEDSPLDSKPSLAASH